MSYGFTSQESIVLHNTSLVDMKFKLRVPGDGTGAPIHADDEANSDSPRARAMSERPREFEIDPESGMLGAMSSVKIEVRLKLLL